MVNNHNCTHCHFDESWIINLDRVFESEEIEDIEIEINDQLIPVGVTK